MLYDVMKFVLELLGCLDECSIHTSRTSKFVGFSLVLYFILLGLVLNL